MSVECEIYLCLGKFGQEHACLVSTTETGVARTRQKSAAISVLRVPSAECRHNRWLSSQSLLDRFRIRKLVVASEPYRLMQRLVEEYCNIEIEVLPPSSQKRPKGGKKGRKGQKERRTRKKVSIDGKKKGEKLQSVHDPDASFGHKGVGYSAHISEMAARSRPGGSGGRSLPPWQLSPRISESTHGASFNFPIFTQLGNFEHKKTALLLTSQSFEVSSTIAVKAAFVNPPSASYSQ